MKTSEVFKRAKEHLCTGEDLSVYTPSHICFAINATTAQNKDKNRVKKIVAKLLYPFPSFRDWLFYTHRINAGSNYKKLQATRHAWLDHLIEHYASIGD